MGVALSSVAGVLPKSPSTAEHFTGNRVELGF